MRQISLTDYFCKGLCPSRQAYRRAGQRHRQQRRRIRRQKPSANRNQRYRQHHQRHPAIHAARVRHRTTQTHRHAGRCRSTAEPKWRHGQENRLHRRQNGGAQYTVYGSTNGEPL